MHKTLQNLLLPNLWIHYGLAWGNLGHRTVALLAQRYLTDEGKRYASSLLAGSSYDDAAVWADVYKTTPEGAYTNSWHFMDAMDDPPLTCNVSFIRDCKPTHVCIVAAMKNMVCSNQL